MNRDQAVDFCDNIHGWMSREAIGWIYDAAHAMAPCSTWVEVGVWKGRSLCAAILGAKVGRKVVGVDTFAGSTREVMDGSQAEALTGLVYVDFIRNFYETKKLNPDALSSFLKMRSVHAAKGFSEKVDRLFLDGDHDDLESDVEAWLPNMKNGGVVSGHDYGYEPVRVVVDRFFGDVKHGPGGIWYARV